MVALNKGVAGGYANTFKPVPKDWTLDGDKPRQRPTRSSLQGERAPGDERDAERAQQLNAGNG